MSFSTNTDSPPPLPDSAAVGEMAALVAAKDWSQTPLGPRDRWPSSLRLMVATILASQFPMAVRWGPDFLQIYNDGYRPILGEKHPDALGRPFREAWPETQPLMGALHRAILAGERGAFFSEDLPLRIRRRGDELEDAFFTISYSPILDETAASGVGGVLVTAVETTARVRVERALRELNETLEQQVAERTRERDRLWRVSDDLIGVARFDGYWAAINPAASAMLGWSEAELLNMPIAALWHPDDIATTLAHRKQLVEGGPTVRFQNRYRHKDGSYRWLSWSSTAEDGFIYALARDVTAERNAADALRRTEEQLRQSQKMEAVGQLTGGIAHDFNNLLTGVVGSLDLMHKRIAQKRFADVERYATLATTSANRAAALTHRLLAFARRQPLDPKPVNVNQLVHSIEELLRRTMGETIRLEIAASDGLWATFCDPHQLESALLNLVINSRDAMPNGGKLTIETANADLDNVQTAELRDVAPGQYVCLNVADTGVGMSPAVRARAFDPFFTTKPLGQGTGLGLSMVYGFARQSEGQVRIESEAGQGTRVTLYLPRYRGAVEEAATATVGERLAKAQAGETVLVIEDEASVRELVIEVLHDLGYRALQAGDGPSGLKILQSPERIDLLVSDIGLPGMNGRQVAEAARERRPDLKVLFITGYADNAAMANGFLEPGMEMVTKPFAVDALAARIRAMIGA
jgi:PAS domain S-box-containing protein